MSVVSRQEAGRRGYIAMTAAHTKAERLKWARKGGKPRNPSLVEILAREAEERQRQGATRREKRRLSKQQEARIAEFDFIS